MNQEIKTIKEFITPDKARDLLSQMATNRKLQKPLVSRIARAIKEGDWNPETGETIKLTKSGKLIDGQYRLNAVIEANTSVWMYVSYNVADNAMNYIDTGKARTAPDVFKINGIAYFSRIPASISFYNFLCADKPGSGRTTIDRETTQELLEQYHENPQYWQELMTKSNYLNEQFSKVLPPSWIAGLITYLEEREQGTGEAFVTQLCVGINVTNPTIQLLRNKLITDKLSHTKLLPSTRLALIIKSWNAFVANKIIVRLRFNPSADDFPSFRFTKKEKTLYFNFKNKQQ